jgi:hypothetical protein
VGRLNTVESEYYPPRARWYSRLLSPWFGLQRALHLEKIRLPVGLSVAQCCLGLVLPGYAFFANNRRVLGWTFAGVYCVLGALFVVALGYPISGLAYGLMIAAHASSIVFLQGYWLRDGSRFGFRLALAGVTLLVVWRVFYAPLIGFAQARWIMPLRVRENVVVVHRLASAGDIKRGDLVMYSMAQGNANRGGGAMVVRSGYGYGPVLAVAGDRVEFSTNGVSFNGRLLPLLLGMPAGGDCVVPEKHWFVWPELDIFQNGNINPDAVSETMLQLALVSEEQFVGKPFNRWFGRRQAIP